ncbi:MAG: putative rane protein [Candidatus Nomurabacteria bacterium]|nr:putative rane protein [Candidatus Nomurabacteria bacterium]
MISKTLGQTARFVLVGILNTGIDFIVFNLLAYYVIGLETGWAYFVCKTTGFLVAMVNSFFFNSRFTFKDNTKKQGAWWRFALVTVFSFLVSLGISTLVFNVLIADTSLSGLLAGNISAVISTAIGMCANFIGYKFFVFQNDQQAA